MKENSKDTGTESSKTNERIFQNNKKKSQSEFGGGDKKLNQEPDVKKQK